MNLQSRTMDKARIIQSISELQESVRKGDTESMYRCAHALNLLFVEEVPEPFGGYDAASIRFRVAEAMISFYLTIGDTSRAGTLRNRIVAHYQTIRKSNEYSVREKHELKETLQRIKALFPATLHGRRSAIDKSDIEHRRELFIIRAYRWFHESHGMLPLEGLRYLKPFNVEALLSTLPVDMPKAEVVEEMTRHCYAMGGSLAPYSLQRRYAIKGETARHLYVIGNGFDLHHGAESGYRNFRRYLYRRSPETVGLFDLYFGPRSLERSFSSPVGWFWCTQPCSYRHKEYGLRYPVATWSRMNLWKDFEANLGELNREKVFDILDMQLPRVDEGEEGFRYSEYYAPLDNITGAVNACTFEMKYHFHRWVNTLHYAKGFRKKMLAIDKDALFLNFNYTLFLESEYGVPAEQICYIHGNRKDKFGSLILGHGSPDEEAFERWRHKNRNRRRYRHVQKDKRGRYFRNDKLAYLAFFHKDDANANWRLPIRYYAVQEAEERLEKYYDFNFKNTAKVIDANMGFFNSLGSVGKVTVIGCSLGTVDMDYYRKLKSSVKDDAHWEISYHSPEDEERIRKFCKELNLDAGCVTTFRM